MERNEEEVHWGMRRRRRSRRSRRRRRRRRPPLHKKVLLSCQHLLYTTMYIYSTVLYI